MKRLLRLLGRWGMLLGLCIVPMALQAETTTGTIEPKAEELLRSVMNRVKAAKTISVTLDAAMTFKASGMMQELQTVYDVKYEKPDILAMVMKEGMYGGSIYSDGTTATIYTPSQKNYVQWPSPEDIKEVVLRGSSNMAVGAADFIWAAEPYDVLVDKVTSGVYAGETNADNIPCHHLKFTQDEIDWEAWVTAGTSEPELLKIEGMMKGAYMKQLQEAAGMSDAAIALGLKFNGWTFDAAIPAESFTFTPPPDATDATEPDNDEESEEPSALIGKPVPDFELPLLSGGIVRMADLKGKVVVLDIWATWCGPCRQALPILNRVADKFKGRANFYAINTEESTSTVQKFVDSQKLTLPILLDEKGELDEDFELDSIPMTVLVGSDGIVHAVHIGLSPDAEEELTSEVEALLRGENLYQKAEAVQTRDESSSAPELTEKWSVGGDWSGIAYDPAIKASVALGNDSFGHVDAAGKVVKEVKVAARGSDLRLAQLNATAEMELLIFTGWGDAVTAVDSDGKELWVKKGGQGIDDVWAGDLTGDGLDEVIIGYNGGTGLHALTSDGKPLWEFKGIGNVWHVTVGDVDGDGKSNVVTTSAAGKVHVFSELGKKMKDINTGFYANMVRAARSDSGAARILSAGSARKKEVVASFDGAGKKGWETVLGDSDAGVDSASVSPDGKRLALSMRGGSIAVLDVETGAVTGKAVVKARTAEVGWAPAVGGDQQLLLVATGDELTAFEVQ